jgi:hypothetical protein
MRRDYINDTLREIRGRWIYTKKWT